MKKWLVAAS
ncbi:hypothetical protein D030_5123A, partial [Vibrio parahaemolyticus AQ3810]